MSRRIDTSAWLINDTWTQSIASLQPYRTLVSAAVTPIQKLLHEAQSKLRVFPESVQRIAEPFQILSAASSLLVESTTQDLLDSLSLNSIERVGISPFPLGNSTPAALAACEANPDRIFLIACSQDQAGLDQQLDHGPRAIRLFPALTGQDEHHEFHHYALEQAQARKVPVLIETSALHTHALMKKPEYRLATRFEGWFRAFPDLQFVLIGMNGDQPTDAVGLATTYSNVWLETSCQPAEVLVNAVKTLGPSRILFGSQWPILGKSQEIAVERMSQAAKLGRWSEEVVARIEFENASQLFFESTS